jgi:hypothetical protein
MADPPALYGRAHAARRDRRTRRAERLQRPSLDQGVREELVREAFDDRPCLVLRLRFDRQLHPPTHAHAVHAGDLQMGQGMLDRLALRVEDAGLGHHVHRVPMTGH